MDVEAFESLADVEEKHAEDQRADQYVERDAELDHHRHAIGGGSCREEQAVFHRQEADHLRYRLAAYDHHQECKQDAGRAQKILKTFKLNSWVIGEIVRSKKKVNLSF